LDRDPDPLGFLGAPVPPAFAVAVVTVPAGAARIYDGDDWRDALVVLARGRLELEFHNGRRQQFERGAVLWLRELPLRALHCVGVEPAVLVAISRR